MLGCPEVSSRGVGAAGEQGARGAVRHRLTLVVDHEDLIGVADGPALGGENDLGVVVEAGHVEQTLGHAEDLLKPRSQDRLDAGGQFVGHAGAAHLQHAKAVAAQRAVLTLVVDPPLRDRRNSGRDGDLFGVDGAQCPLGRRRRQHHCATAGEECAEDARACQREVVAGG